MNSSMSFFESYFFELLKFSYLFYVFIYLVNFFSSKSKAIIIFCFN